MAKRVRDYEEEYASYHGTPLQKKRRADRNRARRKARAKGLVHKGDNMEVDHIGSHRRGRLRDIATRIITRKQNRSRQPDRT